MAGARSFFPPHADAKSTPKAGSNSKKALNVQFPKGISQASNSASAARAGARAAMRGYSGRSVHRSGVCAPPLIASMDEIYPWNCRLRAWEAGTRRAGQDAHAQRTVEVNNSAGSPCREHNCG